MTQQTQSDQLCINTLRTTVDRCGATGKLRSSPHAHGLGPNGILPLAALLRYDPADPEWLNRDRFVLSAGHASALLYSLLYLTGVKAAGPRYDDPGRLAVTLDDLKNFRQVGSRCTGHPEYGWTSGVETTTGPLGQGAATSVGMAIASQWLAATYNPPGFHTGVAGCIIGMHSFGLSAPGKTVAKHFGFEPGHIAGAPGNKLQPMPGSSSTER